MHIKDFTALIQALVVGLANHYKDGTQLPYLDSWIIYENKWRATRYGMDAKLIIDSDGSQEDIREIIKNTIHALEPEINDLSLSDSMNHIVDRIDNKKSYYKEQIDLYNKNKDFKNVLLESIKDLKE